jgi:hypothetical protein
MKKQCHLRLVSSTHSKLDASSRKLRARAAVLRRLANDLERSRHDEDDFDGSWRILAVTMLLVNGDPEELSRDEADYARALRVPGALAAGGR